MAGNRSVSYTHLDVYKRQELTSVSAIYSYYTGELQEYVQEAADRKALLESNESVVTLKPVSYTHLFNADDYQVYYRSDFNETAQLLFEGCKFDVPAGYGRLLGMMMGKYMEYPSEELRMPRHTGIFDPETPYQIYHQRLAETFNGAEAVSYTHLDVYKRQD